MSATQVTQNKRGPNKFESEYIDSMSTRLAKESGLARDWIKKILLQTIPDRERSGDERMPIGGHLYHFKPCLFEAMKSLSAEEVFTLFSGDLEQLRIQEDRFFELINETPFEDFSLLIDTVKDFQVYLKQETKALIEKGNPSKPFEKSLYLERIFLNNLVRRRAYTDLIPDIDYIERHQQFEGTALSDDFLKDILGPKYFRDQREVLKSLLALEPNEEMRSQQQKLRSSLYPHFLGSPDPLRVLKDYLSANKLKAPADLDDKEAAFRMKLHLFSQEALKAFVETHRSQKTETLMAKIWALISSMPYEYLDLIFKGNLSCFSIDYDIDDKHIYSHGRDLIERILVAAAINTESIRTNFLKGIKENLEPVIEDFTDSKSGELKPITYSLYQTIYLCGHESVTSAFGDLAVAKEKLHELKASIKKGTERALKISYNQLQEIKREAAQIEYLRIMGFDGGSPVRSAQELPTLERGIFSESFGEYRSRNSKYPIFQFSSDLKRKAVKALYLAYEAGDARLTSTELIDQIYTEDRAYEITKRTKNPWRLHKDVFREAEPVIKYGMIRKGEKKDGQSTYILDFSFENSAPEETIRLLKGEKEKAKAARTAERTLREERQLKRQKEQEKQKVLEEKTPSLRQNSFGSSFSSRKHRKSSR